ncbi:MAG: PaaI family thioesterase [Betaproteobacteria bacterium]
MTPTSGAAQSPAWVPADADYASRVRESFERQAAMRLLGAHISALSPGRCVVELECRQDLTQQHGYIHAGIVGTIVDSAGGYAGFTLFPVESEVLTVEFKLNLINPARGERLIATGEVVKPGRTLVITRGEVHAEEDGRRTLCAIMQQTLMVMREKPPR